MECLAHLDIMYVVNNIQERTKTNLNQKIQIVIHCKMWVLYMHTALDKQWQNLKLLYTWIRGEVVLCYKSMEEHNPGLEKEEEEIQ